jgi:hypothetical protein
MHAIKSVVTRLTWAGAAGLLAALLPLGPAAAQGVSARAADPVMIIDAGGAGPDVDLRTARRGFDLFGGGDAAVTGMRMTGNMGAALTNYGDCDNVYSIYRCQSSRVVYSPINNVNYAPFFEGEWAIAAPPNEFLKIRQVAPAVNNALGGGWTGGYSTRILGRPPRVGPADNTLGRMFSGVTTTTDGSCRDHQNFGNGYWAAGYQILPGADCPETWGSDGWQGMHPIDQAGFKALFDQQGNGFRWDYWRVPEEFQRTDKQFLGTRHTVYGETSDYSSDILPLYGAAVPGGTGTPTLQGYPLGLKLHFEAFNFGVPTVNGAFFVQLTIINESQNVWGAPIDYDSLYFGMSLGTLFSSQNVSRYSMPEKGLVHYVNSNVQGAGGPCDNVARAPDGGLCLGSASTLRGYRTSALSVIFLKSPLGDLRNKLYTRTLAGAPCTPGVDPFCNPAHPNAGDTLTFNRMAFGNYSSAWNYTFGTGAQATFGFMAANENLTHAGRDPAAQTANTLWTVFRSEDWVSRRDYYNKYVPPSSPAWDYNKDGIPDTLALATCGRLGCAGVDSDTMPGGWLNRRGNIGGYQGFGPFALAAGDTTALIYAMVGGGDSTAYWAQVNAALDLYMNFYLAPDAPPPVRVVSTQVTAGTNEFGTANPAVSVYFSDDPEQWVDPFLSKTADDVEAAPPTSEYGILLANNPWLADSLRTLARNNLDRIEIYKSCNAGATWTSDGDCDGDPTGGADTATSGFGWRTYGVYRMDAYGGDIPNVFTDGNVDGGRTYMYTFVGRSRGATLLLRGDGGDPVSFTFAPAIPNALSRSTSDPNVASVYVPASRPAGYEAASVSYSLRPTATVPFTVSLADNVPAQSYRALFGSEIVVERDSSISTSTGIQSVVTLQRRETVDVGGVGVDSIIRRDVYVYDSPLPFLVTGSAITDLGTVVTGDVARVTTLYGRTVPDTGLAMVLAQADGAPLFGSTALVAGRTTPASLFGREEYRGFTLDLDNSVRGTFRTASEQQYRGEQSRAEQGLPASDTLVNRNNIVIPAMVQWREGSSTKTADGGGEYEISWTDDPFGTDRGFVLNLSNPAATEAEVQASLNGRAVAATGVTDAETATLLGVPQSELVAVKLPFTMANTTFGGRAVEVAMVRRVANRLVLGNNQDTISVEIPADVWVPGDLLYLIETVEEDEVVGGRLVMATPTEPARRTRRAVAFTRAVLGCDRIRESCNPLRQGTSGATAYMPMRNGDKTRFGYYVGLQPTTEYAFDLRGAVSGGAITAVTDSALSLIRVVPNPFVVYSSYQTNITNSAIMFTNLPARGTLRIYTVNAQFVQQIAWEPEDLQGDGDLFWNLRSREGIDIASGLYIWVLTAPSNPNDPASAPLQARGKFVVIRGDAQ